MFHCIDLNEGIHMRSDNANNANNDSVSETWQFCNLNQLGSYLERSYEPLIASE